MKTFKVYLFWAEDCIRGWLAYVGQDHARDATLHVLIEAESGQKAKNKAITMANKDFNGLKITFVNCTHRCFGAHLYPTLIEKLKVAGWDIETWIQKNQKSAKNYS